MTQRSVAAATSAGGDEPLTERRAFLSAPLCPSTHGTTAFVLMFVFQNILTEKDSLIIFIRNFMLYTFWLAKAN